MTIYKALLQEKKKERTKNSYTPRQKGKYRLRIGCVPKYHMKIKQLLDEVEQNIVICQCVSGEQINYLPNRVQ